MIKFDEAVSVEVVEPVVSNDPAPEVPPVSEEQVVPVEGEVKEEVVSEEAVA